MYTVLTANAMVEPKPVVVEQYVEMEERVVLIGTEITWTPERIKLEYKNKAEEYGVSFEQMWNTVMCENPQLDPTLQSHWVLNGVREDSWGISQIHLPSWPSVTHEQATDPEFSSTFMAEKFSQGKARLWTCHRNIYGV